MRRKAWTFNVSVDFWDHHKSVAAGRDGRDLFLCAIGWSGKERTNGHIPTGALGLLAGKVGVTPTAAKKAAAKLLEVGLFERHPTDGWLIHDYCGDDGWQLSAEERDAQAAKVRDRKNRSREKSRVTPPATGDATHASGDGQRVSSHTDSRLVQEVQSSSPEGSGETTTTEWHAETLAACRLLAEHDLERRRAEKPDDAPPADRPDRCEPWLVTGTERRLVTHGAQAEQLAAAGLKGPDIAAQLAHPANGHPPPHLALVPQQPHCSSCGELGHHAAACPTFPDLEARP